MGKSQKGTKQALPPGPDSHLLLGWRSRGWGCGGVAGEGSANSLHLSLLGDPLQHSIWSRATLFPCSPGQWKTEHGRVQGQAISAQRIALFWAIFFFFLIYLTVLGLCCSTWALCCCKQAFCSCSKQGLLSGQVGSVAVAHGLSCPTAGGILVPGWGIKPVWAGGFLTTGPPGKSISWAICIPALGLA